jgi:hypothetical protein
VPQRWGARTRHSRDSDERDQSGKPDFVLTFSSGDQFFVTDESGPQSPEASPANQMAQLQVRDRLERDHDCEH